jgi:MarR family 2-MHQ and catechol resistance regulon transcriptional repressor
MKDIAGFGVTQSQFAVIECLGHLGQLTLGELSRKLLVSGGNTTVVVDNLERDGLVERIHDTHDRRIVSVQLTPKGSELFSNIFVKHAGYVATLAAILSKEEQIELSGLLSKLGHGLMEPK